MNTNVKVRIYWLLAIGMLAFKPVSAQSNYLPGQVITKKNDTISGFVDYRNWGKNPEKIKFKTSLEDNPTTYSPTNVLEIRVQDEIYVSGIVEVETSPTETARLTEGSEMNIIIDTIFLQTLIRGDKSLYYYKTYENRENFYIVQGDKFELLKYKKYLSRQDGSVGAAERQNGRIIAIESKKYLGQLTTYLNDCGTISSALKGLTYTQTDLVNLFQYYYKCSPSDITFAREAERSGIEFGVLAGVSLTQLNFKGDGINFLTDTEFSSSANATAGLFLDFILPRNEGKWSIYNELLFTTYKVEGRDEAFRRPEDFTISETEIGYSYLKINTLIRYKRPVGNLFLFFNAGLSNGIAINETNHTRQEVTFFNDGNTVEGPAVSETRNYEQGFILGTGIKADKFSLEFRFEKGSGMSKLLQLSSPTQRFLLLVGYKL